MTAVSSDVTCQTLTGRRTCGIKPDDVSASAASISKLSVIRLTVPRECGDKSADGSLNRDDWDPFRGQTAEETEALSDYTDLFPGPAGTSARPCQHPLELGHC